jgi:hypothetical protein
VMANSTTMVGGERKVTHIKHTDRLPINGELKHDCATWFESDR